MIAERSAGAAPTELVITRTFDAPRDLVFRAWSEAGRLAQWWGPKGFAIGHCKLDFRPGGTFHYSMRGPGGLEMWGRFAFREVVAPERIVWVNSFADPAGNVVAPPFPDPWPREVLNTVTLTEKGGRTTLTLRAVPIEPTEAERRTFEAGHPSMQGGYGGTFDQLAAYLSRS